MKVKEAKKILPKREFEAFEAVLEDRIGHTSQARLIQKSRLARRLRDKYRDLARQQGNDIRARGTYTVDTRLNDRKAELLQSIMGSLDHELGKQRVSPRAPRKSKDKRKTEAHSKRVAEKTMREARRR
ncbi:MAG: hypothetical protein AB7G93_06695 [Bdellovibrionales bacterium]